MSGARAVKRCLDVGLASVGLVVTAPVQLVAAGAVWASMGRPVLFRQARPGLHGEPFEMVKLRTMHGPDGSTALATDADRLTRTGRLLRSLSLDELPTLWNVLRGEMSIVGPRPLLVEYLKLYSPEQARRHEVRPGLTGLAQVAGRNAISWEERLRLDVEYVESWTLGGDIRIILRTLRAVMTREGTSAEGEATMARFRG